MMEQDRRSDERVRLALEVRWQTASGSYTGRCGDISRRGCHVQTTAPVPGGGRICVEIRLAAGNWLPLCGEVVNHQPGAGLSIRFEDLPATSQEMLAHLINYFREGQSMSW
ncbi:MAG: PilZ domain-containing protein [Pyrinomonadaceae bacterium]|nr:PilZ domain-containing protein [Pyrinomonadaceae bacterium]